MCHRDTLSTAAVAEASPRVRWVQIADAGRSIHRDQFEASMAAVRAFLNEQNA